MRPLFGSASPNRNFHPQEALRISSRPLDLSCIAFWPSAVPVGSLASLKTKKKRKRRLPFPLSSRPLEGAIESVLEASSSLEAEREVKVVAHGQPRRNFASRGGGFGGAG